MNGKGIVNNLGLQLEANIKEPKGIISLKLDLPSQVDQSITLKLSGQNVSKKLILIIFFFLYKLNFFISSFLPISKTSGW